MYAVTMKMFTSILFIVLLCFSPLAGHTMTPEKAPYQIVNATVKDGILEVTVDAGAEGNVPERVTMLISRGAGYVHASLVAKQRACVWLCGQDSGKPQTCHYEATYRAKVAGPVGEVVAMLPYLTRIYKHEMIEKLQHPSRMPLHLQNHVGKTVFEPMYPNDLAFRLQGWDFDTDSLIFDYRAKQFSGPYQEAMIPECAIYGQDRFLNMACGENVSLMFDDQNLLFVSFADYGIAETKILMGFDMNGQRHYLVRLGLKAEAVVGLMEPDGKGGWIVRLRPSDYPLIC